MLRVTTFQNLKISKARKIYQVSVKKYVSVENALFHTLIIFLLLTKDI